MPHASIWWEWHEWSDDAALRYTPYLRNDSMTNRIRDSILHLMISFESSLIFMQWLWIEIIISIIISSQFSRKSILDSLSDIDFFDLEVHLSSSLKWLNKSFDKYVLLKQFISFVNSSRTQSSRNYERKHQNDFFIRDNAIKRFFRVLNMTNRNKKSVNFHEFLTLRQNRRAFKLNNSDRRNLDWINFQRFRRIINIRESQKIQNRQSQDSNDHSKIN